MSENKEQPDQEAEPKKEIIQANNFEELYAILKLPENNVPENIIKKIQMWEARVRNYALYPGFDPIEIMHRNFNEDLKVIPEENGLRDKVSELLYGELEKMLEAMHKVPKVIKKMKEEEEGKKDK